MSGIPSAAGRRSGRSRRTEDVAVLGELGAAERDSGGARAAASSRRGATYRAVPPEPQPPKHAAYSGWLRWIACYSRTRPAAEARCAVTVAAAALAAFPASLLTIWLLLRTPAARHVVAAPRADRWHTKSTPLLGGSGFIAGLLVGAGIALAAGAIPASARARRHPRRLRDPLRRRPARRRLHALAAREDRGPGRRRRARPRLGCSRRDRLERHPRDRDRRRLDRRHDERLQPARQHGRPRRDARRDRVRVLRDRRVHGPPERPRRACSRSALFFACLGFLPLQPAPAAARPPSSWATAAASCSASRVASLGLASSWTVAGSTVATLLLPILVLAVPILDTTLVTVVRLLEGRPVTKGGRDHTSHRLVYRGLSDKRAVILLCVVSAALGLTSLAYKVLDDTLVTLAGVLVTFAVPPAVRQLPRRREPSTRDGRSRRSSARCSCTGAGSSRCSSTSR